MCMSASPSIMSDTRVYAGVATHNDRTVHVLAYQNTAQSNTQNAMILPFPASERMTQGNIVDTSKFPTFLERIGEASREVLRRTKSLGPDKSFDFAEISDGILFDSGSYSVVLAQNVDAIQPLLKDVAPAKRPVISDELLKWLGEYYVGCQFAVCCWNGQIEAEPLLWWYEPKDPKRLFIPTMDAHDGGPPQIGSRVGVDHLISVSRENASQVQYRQEIPADVFHLLPQTVDGIKMDGKFMNGDTWVDLSNPKQEAPGRDIFGLTRRENATVLLRGDFQQDKAFDQRSMWGWA